MTAMSELKTFASRDHVDTAGFKALGPCAEAIRAGAWERTPLGPLQGWDASLVSALNLMLSTRFPMFLTWGEDNHLFFNDAYAPVLTGKPNPMGQPFHKVFPEARAEVGPLLDRALQGESVYLEDFHVPLSRDGKIADSWWSFCYSPILSDSGQINGVLGVVHETTRRVLTEQALWSNEAALRGLMDKTPALMWRCEPDGRLHWANQRLEDYAGVRATAHARWNDFVHPADLAEARAIHAQCLAEGRPFETQQRLARKDGTFRWHVVRAQQLFDETGKVVGWCGSAVDIDDWRAAADQVSAEDARFREISTAATSLIWSADVASRRLEGLNPRFRSAWTLPCDGAPILWEDWVATLHPEDRGDMARIFDRVAAGETVESNFRADGPDGAPRWFHATAFPIIDPSGAVRRIGGLLVEITRPCDSRAYLVGMDQGEVLTQRLTHDGFRVRRFSSLSNLLAVIDDLLPGAVVIGPQEALADIVDAAPALKLNASRLPWIVVGSMQDHLSEVVLLMKNGAANVLSDSASFETIRSAVLAVQPARERPAQPAASPEARQKIAQLTTRERQVLDGLVAGGTNKTIALALSLSPRTVETYRAQLMDRLGVRTLAELLRLAAEAAPPAAPH